MAQTDRVLKRDAAGRVWTPRAQRAAAVEAFEGSGMSATKFAAHIGVKYQTFISWVQKRRKLGTGGGPEADRAPVVRALGGWVEAKVEIGGEPSAGALSVHLPGGARLEVTNARQAGLAAQVLRALAQGAVGC